jgi:shikimate dehydrogenase
MSDADGLINATPVGMFQYPGCVFPASRLNVQRWAFDAVYTPEHTEFMAGCRARGIPTLSGFKLFLYQGLDAWKHFTGSSADAGSIERAFLQRYAAAG